MNLRSPKRFYLAAAFGVALLAGLTCFWSLDGVALAVASAGWGAALVILVRLGQILLAGYAWRSVLRANVSWWVCPLLRWVREAVDVLLPVAQVGGEIVGARLLTRFGAGGAPATASVLADMLVQVSTQVMFCLLGLGLLFMKSGDSDLALSMGSGVFLLALGAGGFLAVQRWGGVNWLERRVLALAAAHGWPLPGGVAGLGASLGAIHRARARLALAGVIHMAIWIFGSLEVWIALRFLGLPVGFGEALVIESLSHAARAALFVVPGGLGVQEGAIVALGAAYGVPPQLALAVGLLKRIPDLVLGVLGLAVWQAVELRTLRREPGKIYRSALDSR